MSSILRLMRYIAPFRKYVMIAVATMVVQVFVSFFIPFLMIEIIDEALPARDFDTVLRISLMMLALAFLGIAAGVANAYTSQYISQYATADLRLELFNRIQELSFKNVDDFKQSRLITNATNDVLRVQMFFTMMLRIVIRAPLMIIIGLMLALSTSLRLSQVFYITIPLLILAVGLIMYHAYPRFKKVQHALDDLNNVVLENANAPQVIKSFVSQPHEAQRFEGRNENYRQANTAAETVMAFADPAINLIFNVGVAMILVFGSYYMQQGDFISAAGIPQVGVLMAFNQYSQQILIGLMMFAMVMVFLSRANVSAARINEIFDAKIELRNPDDGIVRDIEGRIRFDDVDFGYGDDGNLALRGVSLDIAPGERIGIIGSTGSGKSSLVQLIPRLYDVKRGRVEIDGISVTRYDLPALRRQIGFVTQNAIVFSGSLATNIRQGREEADFDAIDEASEGALLKDFSEEIEEGYNHLVQAKGVNLSGGQKQRLSIARALIRKPPILILDDATSAVDAESERRLLANLDAFEHAPTLLMVSQKVATVRRMDRILVLSDEGRPDGVGTHQELLEISPVYQEIVKSQIGFEGGGLDG